jgi:hypothetical protein
MQTGSLLEQNYQNDLMHELLHDPWQTRVEKDLLIYKPFCFVIQTSGDAIKTGVMNFSYLDY